MRPVVSSFATACLLGFVACAPAPGPSVLSYDEFKAQAFHDAETDTFVVNGDELIESEQAMRTAYDSYVDSAAETAEPGLGISQQGLIVNRVGSSDDK